MVYSADFTFDLQRFADVSDFGSLKAALENGGDIKLTAKIDATEDLTIGKNTTIDLAGFELNLSDKKITVSNGKTFTLDDSTKDATTGISANGKISGTSKTLVQVGSEYDNSIKSMPANKSGVAKFVMNGGQIGCTDTSITGKTSEKAAVQVGVAGKKDDVEGYLSDGATVYRQNVTPGIFEMNGGKIEGKSTGINIDGQSEVTITDGTVSSDNSTAIFFGLGPTNGGGTLNMTGGTVQSKSKDATIRTNGLQEGDTKINISGGTVIFNTTETSGNLSAIYAATVGTLTISDNAEIVSNRVGVEIRKGNLDVTGGKIKVGKLTEVETYISEHTNLTDDEKTEIRNNAIGGYVVEATDGQVDYHSSEAGNSCTNGVAIAVAQHGTKKDITVNISGGEVEGYNALAVLGTTVKEDFDDSVTSVSSNMWHDGEKRAGSDSYVVGTVEVNVTGGTLTSNSEDTEDKADDTGKITTSYGSTVTQYELKGKNAIYNGDKRVKISVENTVIKGALAAVNLAKRTEEAYELKEGNTYSNFTGDSTALFPYYYATKTTGTVIDVAILGTEGWNKKAIDNNWDYVVAPTGTESVGTALTQLIADSTKGAFSLTSGANTTASIVSFDANNNLFKDLTYKSGDETKYYTVIDASSANDLTSFNITGNERITSISGGAGNDSIKPAGEVDSVTLTGGDGNDLFFFDGNKNTITDFGTDNDSVTLANSKFRPANADFLATKEGDKGKITIDFGGGDALMFENLDDETEVSLPGGHVFATRYHAFDKQITFTSVKDDAFDATSEAKFANYATIDAASASAISIMGNSLSNRIIGSNQGGSLNGGAGNDRLIVTDRNSSAKYLFEYTEGKDSIEGFDDANDTLAVDAAKITEAKGSGSKLTLTFGKDNSVVLKSDVDIEKVSLSATSSDYLTSSGYFANDTFKLFANAKGKIDLTDTPYKDTGIKTIDATKATKQSVTLTADKNVTTVKLAENNKKDLFVYGGGSVSIIGYEAGTDKLNIADVGAVSLFTVGDEGVSINAGGTNTISLQGALEDQEVLIRDGGKSNSYQKFVFHADGVLYNKGKKPTEANIYSNVNKGAVVQVADSVKKIFLQAGVSGASIQSGNNKATLDASEANGVTLIGGAKNNKFIASAGDDLFVYKGGKDNIQGFDAKDEISFNATDFDLNNAKISASGKSLKFKFTNKNALTLKSDSKITSASINGGNYSFSKNAVGLNGVVSLTSQFSGTYKLADGVTAVDGSAVKKNLTFKGTDAAESLSGGQKKTTFKGGGGDDIFYGGTGKDVFFYAKTDSGNKTIENFGFGSNNDKIKIASGTIKTISKSGNDIIFSTNGGSLTLDKNAEKNVLLKANNTYYWFDEKDNLITADTKVSNAQAVATGYDVIDLSYSTNLVKTNLATKAGSFTFSQGSITKNNTTT